MPISTDPEVAKDDSSPCFSNAIISSYLDYLKHSEWQSAIKEILTTLGIEESVLREVNQWHTATFQENFIHEIKNHVRESDLSYKVAKKVFEQKKLQFFSSVAGTLIDPLIIFRKLPEWTRRMNSYNSFEVQVVHDRLHSARIRITQNYRDRDRAFLNAELSAAARGSICGLLEFCDCTLLDLTVCESVEHGALKCVFEVAWTKKNFLLKAAGFLLISGGVYALLSRTKPETSITNLISSMAISLSAQLLFYGYCSKKALRESYRFQQKTLEDLRNIVDEKLSLNQALVSYQNQLTQTLTMASLGEISFGFAHDIAGPVTILKMNIEMLSKRMQSNADPASLKKLLASTEQAIQRVVRLTALVRSGLKGSEKKAQVQNLGQIASDLIALYRPYLERNQIEGSCELGEGNLELVTLDGAIEVILMNLLQNAARILTKCPVRKIVISVLPGPDKIELIVKDSGPGIPPERLANLWQRFGFSAESTGFGLYNVKKLADEIGAELEVTSNANGTAFTLHVPRATLAGDSTTHSA